MGLHSRAVGEGRGSRVRVAQPMWTARARAGPPAPRRPGWLAESTRVSPEPGAASASDPAPPLWALGWQSPPAGFQLPSTDSAVLVSLFPAPRSSLATPEGTPRILAALPSA